MEVQAQLSALLGLHGTANSGMSITSIASFAANTDPETAYQQFCDGLYRIGVAKDMVQQNKDKILEILRSQGMVTTIQIGGSESIEDKDQVLEAAYEEYCKDLYRIGFTDDMILQQKDRILGILRSRGMDTSSKPKVKGKNSSSSKNLPSFRLTSRVNWFESSSEAGSAPLDISASHSHIGIVELVFGKGSPTHQDNKMTPLHVAAQGGYTWLAELLLCRTPPPKGCTSDIVEPVSLVELLFSKGASIEARYKREYTPLKLAIRNGHTDIVDLLLSKGASIGAFDHQGETPLHLAAQKGCTGIVELLLKKGASPEAKVQSSDRTPLHYAAEHGHTGIVELLLKKGASPNATVQWSYRTPLHYAAEHGHTGIVELLLKQGASAEAKDHRHNTPIHVAALHGCTNVVDLLLSKGVSVIEAGGRTLLHSAAQGGSTGVVEFLLEKGAPVNIIDDFRTTPLHLAAGKGHTNIVRLLLGKGASIDAQHHWDSTPLHNAAQEGHIDTVKLLLEEGASLKVKDGWSRTPLHLAKTSHQFETAQILKNKAAELRRTRFPLLAPIFRKK